MPIGNGDNDRTNEILENINYKLEKQYVNNYAKIKRTWKICVLYSIGKGSLYQYRIVINMKYDELWYSWLNYKPSRTRG